MADSVVNHSLAVLSRFHGDVSAAETHLVKEAFRRHAHLMSANQSAEGAGLDVSGEEPGDVWEEPGGILDEGEGMDSRLDNELLRFIRDESVDFNVRLPVIG